jgi:hypothetical protein
MAIAPASEKYFWLSPVTKRDRCLLGCPGLREVAVRRHIGSENRSKPTFCPLRVTSGHSGPFASCPLYPQQRTFVSALSMSALCH